MHSFASHLATTSVERTTAMVGEEKAWFSEEALRQKATW